MGWLDRFPGRKRTNGPEALTSVQPGDQIQAGGETWRKIRNGPLTQYGGWRAYIAAAGVKS